MHDSSFDYWNCIWPLKLANLFNEFFFFYLLPYTTSIRATVDIYSIAKAGKKDMVQAFGIGFVWTSWLLWPFLVVGYIRRRQNRYDPSRVDMVQFDGWAFHVENGKFCTVLFPRLVNLHNFLFDFPFQHVAETQSLGLSSALLIVYIDSATSLPVKKKKKNKKKFLKKLSNKLFIPSNFFSRVLEHHRNQILTW